MRVLILANNDMGLYKFRKELIEELLYQKNEVYISLPDGELVRPFEEMGCSFINTPVDRRSINPKTDLNLFNRYRNMMREVNPDLVVTYTIKPNIYGGIAARLAKKNYAVNITGLGSAFENAGLIRNIVVKLYKYALKKAKVVFFENRANRDELLLFKVCDKTQTVVLNGAGVNTETYSYLPYPQEKKESHDEQIKFLFIGRVMKEKGIDELFEAMKRLVAEGKQCFLDVVGPFEEDYKDKLEQYEKYGWLKYHGYQSDVRPFIESCHCFVLPSYHEGMANANLECASSGRPIITSNIPGCKEAVNDGSGLLCEPNNTDSLYTCMKKMAEFPRKKREEMGIAGRRHMEKVFDKQKVVEKTISYLF